MKTMFGWLFSFCFLHETVFGNGQIAITHNDWIYAGYSKRWGYRLYNGAMGFAANNAV